MKNILLLFLALCSPLSAQVQLGNHVQVGGAGGGGGAQLQIFIPDPLGMQHVVVYPTTVSAVCGGSSCFPAFSSAVGSNVYAGGTVAPHNVIAGATINVAFGGYTLPSYVLAANVTSVYGYNVSEQFGEITSDVDCTWTGSGTTFVSNGNGTYTVPFSGLTGAHIPSVSCTGAWISSVFTAPFISSGVTVGPMALIVYYTGTAPPASNAINVEFPLHFTQNTLSINPTAPFPGLYAIPYTVAQLPTSATFPVPPALGAYLVSDEASAGNCASGGGGNLGFCYWNGSNYVAIGGGGGGGTTTNPLTLNNSGAGASSGATFNGSAPITASYNTFGAPGLAAATNAFTGTLNDYSGTAQFKLPVTAAYAPAANGEIGYDSTNKNWHVWSNAANNIVPLILNSATITNGDCAELLNTSSVITLTDSGAPCGGGGSTAWSAITNPSGNLALTMAAHTSTFTYGATTGSSDLFALTDTASNTGTGIILHAFTAAGSTEIPWQADANGTGFKLDELGRLVGVGSSASHGMFMPTGTLPSPIASTAGVFSDPSGNLFGSENGAAFSRFCTAANAATNTGCQSSSSGVASFSGDGTLISNSASTGAVTATLATAAAHKFFGNNTGSTTTPGYESIGTGDLPTGIPNANLANPSTNVHGATCTLGSTCLATLPLSCQPGLGDGLNAIPAGTYLTTTCRNETGGTWTLTAIRCVTDSGSSTCNVTNGAGTALLTGAITGSSTYANGTQSGTTTISSGDFLKVTYITDGTTKQIGIDVAGTF